MWQRLEEYEKTLAPIVDNVKEERECSDGIPSVGPPAPGRIEHFIHGW
jgi:hypothetical protein